LTQTVVAERSGANGVVEGVTLHGASVNRSGYTRPPLILNFTEIQPEHAEFVGGKGLSLGRLAGIFPDNTKPGIVISTETYELFLKATGLRRVIRNILAKINLQSQWSLQTRAALIRWHIRNADTPESLLEVLVPALQKIDPNVPKAVRSSMKSEDGKKDSFAGQQATFLNVVGLENIIDAIRECWASLFEARAIAYRAMNGYDHLKESMAVPVMDMVQAEAAGTFFTVDPNNPTSSLIEAAFGLGEAVVSGEVDPDEYSIDRKTGVIDITVRRQTRMIVRNPKADGKPTHRKSWVRVFKIKQEQQKLPTEVALELNQYGKVLEEHYGGHVDAEWAYEKGRLYLLQARPITAIDDVTVEIKLVEEPAKRILTGQGAAPGVGYGRVVHVRTLRDAVKFRKGDVLVAPMTNPDFVPIMKLASAIITERGGRTCHAAVVSRELGIPCIVGAAGAMVTLIPGSYITADGSHGEIFEGEAKTRIAWGESYKHRFEKFSILDTTTKIMVNLAEPDEDIISRTAAMHVAGIGLLRAEFIVAHMGRHPKSMKREEFKERLKDGIRKFLKAFGNRPVVYRFTDFKTSEYRGLKGGKRWEPEEEDPMIGYRGASRYIADPELFEVEIEAIKDLREKEGFINLWAMIPFVRTTNELETVKDILEDNGLVRSDTFKLWMMVEVPSNAILIDKFIEIGIDGVSIGTNDLTQLVLGVGRNLEKVASIFDERNHAVMRAVKHVVQTCRAAGLTVSVCGQAPSVYPEFAARCVEWGVTSLSVSPDAVGITKLYVWRAEHKTSEMPLVA